MLFEDWQCAALLVNDKKVALQESAARTMQSSLRSRFSSVESGPMGQINEGAFEDILTSGS